jgi:hypothetical protein
MLTTVQGFYRNGSVELIENPPNISEGTIAIITFIKSDEINLADQGINPKQAKILREKLATFSEDWDSPEMSIYDNYDTAKVNL